MTEYEQDAAIGKMFRERKELRTRLTCIENKLNNTRLAFQALAHALQTGEEDWFFDPNINRHCVRITHPRHHNLPGTVSFPDGKEVRDLLKAQAETTARLEELDKALDA